MKVRDRIDNFIFFRSIEISYLGVKVFFWVRISVVIFVNCEFNKVFVKVSRVGDIDVKVGNRD